MSNRNNDAVDLFMLHVFDDIVPNDIYDKEFIVIEDTVSQTWSVLYWGPDKVFPTEERLKILVGNYVGSFEKWKFIEVYDKKFYFVNHDSFNLFLLKNIRVTDQYKDQSGLYFYKDFVTVHVDFSGYPDYFENQKLYHHLVKEQIKYERVLKNVKNEIEKFPLEYRLLYEVEKKE